MIPSPHFRDGVLASVGGALGRWSPHGTKHIIFPMKRPINRSIDNGGVLENREAVLSIISGPVPQVSYLEGLS
jgi:hypothetical protein